MEKMLTEKEAPKVINPRKRTSRKGSLNKVFPKNIPKFYDSKKIKCVLINVDHFFTFIYSA